MRRPRHARLRLIVSLLDHCRRGRDDDEMVATGALDLSAGKLAFALDMLIAMRAGEFEFAHRPYGSMEIRSVPPLKQKSRRSNLNLLHSNGRFTTSRGCITNRLPANHANDAKGKQSFGVIWRVWRVTRSMRFPVNPPRTRPGFSGKPGARARNPVSPAPSRRP